MILDYKFYVGFKDINSKLEMKNSSMLTFFENIAGMHASLVGDGFKESLETTHTTWLLLSWKVKMFKRPEHGDNVIARTWVSSFKRVYSYREFELLSKKGELLGVCGTKWVKVDVEKGLPSRGAINMNGLYDTEERTNFPEGFDVRLSEPETHNFEYTYKIPLDWIDMNYHMNNTRYLTLAQYAFIENSLDFPEFDTFEIMYKKEVKYGETLKCFITREQDAFIVTVKSEDEAVLHTIIKLYKQ